MEPQLSSRMLGANLLLLLMGKSFMQRQVQGDPRRCGSGFLGSVPISDPRWDHGKTVQADSSHALCPYKRGERSSGQAVSVEAERIPSLLLAKGGCDVSAMPPGCLYLRASIFEALGWKSSCSAQSKGPATNLGREFTAASENEQINK